MSKKVLIVTSSLRADGFVAICRQRVYNSTNTRLRGGRMER